MEIDEKYDQLYKRIGKTREARILASERLAHFDEHYQIIQLIYAVFFMTLSVWVFYLEKTGRMVSASDASTILLICSFSITGTSFYVNGKNYKERSLQLKTNYISLGKLLYDIEVARCLTVSLEECVKKYQEHYEKYTNFLENVENHTTFDYFNIRLSRGEKLTNSEWIKYGWWFLKNYVISWVIALIPMVSVWWLIFY